MSRRRLYKHPVLVGTTRRPDGQPLTHYPHPIHDAEAFCQHHLDNALQTWGMYLNHEDYEDSLQELLRHLLHLEKAFNPERNDSFANYARTYLPRRAVDAGPRRILGRTGNRLHNHLHDQLDESTPRTRHATTLTQEPSHTHPDLGPDDPRLQPERNRQEARAKAVLDLLTT